MRVTIHLFARLREIAGESELPQDLPDEATVRTAWEATVAAFPSLAQYERSLSAAVNDDYARFTTPLHDGDDVAFLPPVSGGENRIQKTEDRKQKATDCLRRLIDSDRSRSANIRLTANDF